MHFRNPHADRRAYEPALGDIMNMAAARESRSWLSTWRYLTPGPTPAWTLPKLARTLAIGQLVVKDESKRSVLESFKALGAPLALLRLVLRRWPGRNFTAEGLLAGSHAAALRDFTVISATDGNHGRALAAAANSIGCRCVIVLHANVSPEREQPIAALGAEVVRVPGNYDDSVEEAARLARANGWEVVSDTSYPGYEEVPRDVMQGYAILADEILEAAGNQSACPFTHVILQGGVGGLAAGVVSYFWERYGAGRPTFIVVEPEQADCLLQSARSGRAERATGSVDSVMAGLACGEASPLAWRFLQPAVDLFMTVSDAEAVQAMRLLASGSAGDIPVLGGESGAAGLAGLQNLLATPEAAALAGLDAKSRVLLFNTEGATAPALYESLTGMSRDSVLADQRAWQAGHFRSA